MKHNPCPWLMCSKQHANRFFVNETSMLQGSVVDSVYSSDYEPESQSRPGEDSRLFIVLDRLDRCRTC